MSKRVVRYISGWTDPRSLYREEKKTPDLKSKPVKPRSIIRSIDGVPYNEQESSK